MTETLTIVLSILGACGAFGAGAAKYYTERHEDEPQEVVQVIPPARPNTPIHSLENLIAHQLEQRNSDNDTEVDIKIVIHTTNHDLKE